MTTETKKVVTVEHVLQDAEHPLFEVYVGDGADKQRLGWVPNELYEGNVRAPAYERGVYSLDMSGIEHLFKQEEEGSLDRIV